MKTSTLLKRSVAGFALTFALGATSLHAQERSRDIDFGDNASEYARDGECDDPRFIGIGTASEPLQSNHMFHDAADCEEAFEDGHIRLRTGEDSADYNELISDIKEEWAFDVEPLPRGFDFGRDDGEYALDGECDDSRFERPDGPITIDNHVGADASDCEAEYEAGTVRLTDGAEDIELPERIDIDEIDFGDDSGEFTEDGECDDPRFSGALAVGGSPDESGTDATDCRALYADGKISFFQGGGTLPDGFSFGNDTGDYAEDGECDDARFENRFGPIDFEEHVGRDASDCRAEFDAGTIRLIDGAEDVAIESSSSADFEVEPLPADFEFGDDYGDFADDGECDDARFETADGPIDIEDHIGIDASDCEADYEAGRIRLREDVDYALPASADASEIDFGEDSGEYTFDGECDDPRFFGPGAVWSAPEEARTDATDCKQLFEDGEIRYRGELED